MTLHLGDPEYDQGARPHFASTASTLPFSKPCSDRGFPEIVRSGVVPSHFPFVHETPQTPRPPLELGHSFTQP